MEIIVPPLSPQLRIRLILQMVFSFTTLLLAAILTILLSLNGFSGVATTAPLQPGTCGNSFFSNKYGKADRSTKIVFFMSIISIIVQIVICLLFFTPLLMRLRPNPIRMAAAYILSGLHTMAVVVAFGKYLTFQVELKSMTNCTVTYVESLIAILLAFTASDFLASLLQFCATMAIVSHLNLELEDGEPYKIVSNVTNYTIQSIENRNRHNFQTLNKPATQTKPTETVKKQPQRNQSHDQLKRREYESRGNRSKRQRGIFVDKNSSSLIKPSFNRRNPIQQQESFHSMMKEQKAALRINRGPILSNSNMQEGENANRTQGYMSYIRKMNSGQSSGETEGGLIAAIRSKYGK